MSPDGICTINTGPSENETMSNCVLISNNYHIYSGKGDNKLGMQLN